MAAARRSGLFGAAMTMLLPSVLGCAPAAPAPPVIPAANSAPLGGDPIAPVINSYRFNSGDRLRVTVYRQLDLSGEFDLDGDGSFALPLLGEVQAAGRTARELEGTIETGLKDGGFLVDPQVGVQVLTYRPFYILGEINQPGSYPYVSGMTAINAIALAGGFTARARRSAVTISHGDQGPERSTDLTAEILPGDVLTVHERFF